jgi:hypothetical protein
LDGLNSKTKKERKMTVVAIKKIDHKLALYHRYSCSPGPQPCFLELDCETGVLSCDWIAEIGNAIPARVHSGHVARWEIPCLSAASANSLMECCMDDAQIIVDGFKTFWDGNNTCGCLSESGQDALEHIQRTCEEIDAEMCAVKAWDSADWFLGAEPSHHWVKAFGITGRSTEDQLKCICDELQSELVDIDILTGLDEFLAYLRSVAEKEN